jgi:hypothetical protein
LGYRSWQVLGSEEGHSKNSGLFWNSAHSLDGAPSSRAGPQKRNKVFLSSCGGMVLEESISPEEQKIL